MSLQQEGTMLVDVQNPLVQASSMKQKGTMEMTVGDPKADQAMTMTIEMDGTTATKVEPGVYKEPQTEAKPAAAAPAGGSF